MATITQETRFELDKRELVGVRDARDHLLRCETGELWLTIDGEAGDVILRPGETWRIGSDAELVVSALQPSTLSLSHRQALGSLAGAARRMLWSLRGWSFPPLAAFPAQLIR